MRPLLIDGLFLQPTKVGGCESYFYNLIDGMVELGQDADLWVNQSYLRAEKYEKKISSLKWNRGLYENFYSLQNQELKDYQAVLFTNYITPLWGCKARKVTVIHDAQYLVYPEFFSLPKRLWLRAQHINSLKQADVVVAISQFVKDQLVFAYGNKYANKIVVIHNPIASMEKPLLLKTKKTEKKIILSVAAHYPHKNLITLVNAFHLLSKETQDYQLVLVGQLSHQLIGGQMNQELYASISGNKNILVTGFVSPEVLQNYYQNADLFVFPSVFEGFGMPVVEAMIYGIPTITTTKASLPEVTQNKAIYVQDTYDIYEWKNKMIQVLENRTHWRSVFQSHASTIKHAYQPSFIAQKYLSILFS